MNPLLSAALGSILRWGLAVLAGFLVQHGVWTSTEATMYVAAASLALLSLGLSLWNKYRGRLTLLTALTMPVGTTENDVKAKISRGDVVPSVTTPSDTVPGVP